MARRKGIFVRRQNQGPTVRLNFARSFAATGALERAEQKDPRDGGRSARPDGGEALLSTVNQQNQAVIVRIDLVPNSSSDGHTHSSAARCGIATQRECLRALG